MLSRSLGAGEFATVEGRPYVERLAGRPATKAHRTLGKVALLGTLIFLYLLGWLVELDRIARIQAEPAPPFKVITKAEAWNLIYHPGRR